MDSLKKKKDQKSTQQKRKYHKFLTQVRSFFVNIPYITHNATMTADSLATD